MCPQHAHTPFSHPADLLKLALAGHGLANTLLFLYYPATVRTILLPLELAVNGAACALPALDLLTRGSDARVSAIGGSRGGALLLAGCPFNRHFDACA